MVKNVQSNPIKTIEARFNRALNDLNSNLDKPYSISFSWGYTLGNVEDNFDSIYEKAEINLMEFKKTKFNL